MVIHFDFWPTLTFSAVTLCWFTFVVAFLVRKKPPAAPESKRERGSILGTALQGLAYAIVWAAHRPVFSTIVPMSKPPEMALSILTMALAISYWIALVIAVAVFAIGTWIRVRSEEKLLREAFGTQFEEYARRVPAVVPFLFEREAF